MYVYFAIHIRKNKSSIHLELELSNFQLQQIFPPPWTFGPHPQGPRVGFTYKVGLVKSL